MEKPCIAALALSVVLPVSAAPPLSAQAGASTVDDASLPTTGAAAITPSDLRRRVGVLAHDSMRGRDTPSPELEETARYVADQFESFGLRPAFGSDGYLQRFPVTVVRPGSATDQSVELRGPSGDVRLEPRRDFVAAPTGDAATATGPLRMWDPDTRDAAPEEGILVVTATRQNIGGRLGRVRDALKNGGAWGALIAVHESETFFGRLQRFFGSEQVSLGEPDALTKPVILVRHSSLPGEVARMADRGWGSPVDWSAELQTEAAVEGAEAMNAIGWIRGSDPRLRDEYVVFTAHMDHVGVGGAVNGDSIYNGADDDASGTATILELAQAFASAATTSPPRRSLVFMTVSGEEKGLLGSRWYSEHPVFSLDRTVANLNVDMIGRNWKDTVAAIGKEESTLGATVERVAAEHPGLGLTVVDDRWPEQNFYYRSDHYNFARKGVPVLFFFSGVHGDYHRPSDEIGKLDFEKTSRIVRLLYHLGEEIANADERPEWDPQAYDRVVDEADGG